MFRGLPKKSKTQEKYKIREKREFQFEELCVEIHLVYWNRHGMRQIFFLVIVFDFVIFMYYFCMLFSFFFLLLPTFSSFYSMQVARSGANTITTTIKSTKRDSNKMFSTFSMFNVLNLKENPQMVSIFGTFFPLFLSLSLFLHSSYVFAL